MVNGYQIHRCAESTTEFVWPMPDGGTLKKFYDRSAYFEKAEFGGYTNYDAQTSPLLLRLENLLDRFPNAGAGLSILDVGCAYGSYLRIAADKGWRCFGIEPSVYAREVAAKRYGNRLMIFERIEDMPPQRFDLVLMLDILEHLPDPFVPFLSLFSRGAIGPDTLVLITTPNANSRDAVEDRGGWIYRHPPSHLVYYSASSLELLLQRLRFKTIRIAGAHPLPSRAMTPRNLDDFPDDHLTEFAAIDCECSGNDFYSFMKERYVPGTWSGIADYEHLPRYALARTFAAGKRVLDFGCGAGYGAASMAEVAESVTGVDIDSAAIEWARRSHRAPNLHFEQRDDLCRGCARGSFDLITCFEVIEHVTHETQVELVRSLSELLAPAGKLIISTPNPQVTALYGDNPYHVREMTEREFLELLEPVFGGIQVFAQWIGPGVLICLQPFKEGSPAMVNTLAGADNVDVPVAYIALCSREPAEAAVGLCSLELGSFVSDKIETERRLCTLLLENCELKRRLASSEAELAACGNSRMLRLAKLIRNEPFSSKKMMRILYMAGSIALPGSVKRRILSAAPFLRSRYGFSRKTIPPNESARESLMAPSGASRSDKQSGTAMDTQTNAAGKSRDSRSGLKIAIFVHCFFPRHFFGTETYTLQLAKNLQQMGHEPAVVCAASPGEPRQIEMVTQYRYKGISVYCIDMNYAPPSRIRETYFNEGLRSVYVDLLNRIRPDLVHVTHLINHTAVLLEVVDELGLPRVATMTDFFGFCFNCWLKRADGSTCRGPNISRTNCIACYLETGICGGLGRRAAKWPRLADLGLGAMSCIPMRKVRPYAQMRQDLKMRPNFLAARYLKYGAVIAPSRFLRDAYTANGLSMRCFHIPYGVDLPRDPKTSRTSDQPLTFGFMGQLAPHKGVDLLIDAFTRLPRGAAKLRIYGPEDRGPEFVADLERAADGYSISFHGAYALEETAKVLGGIDVLVVPSRWGENAPLVLLNALATHTPVISSDGGGLTEFIEEGRSGFTFAMGNAAALEEVMLRFVRDPKLAERLSQSTEYLWTTRSVAEETLKVYDFALKNANALPAQ